MFRMDVLFLKIGYFIPCQSYSHENCLMNSWKTGNVVRSVQIWAKPCRTNWPREGKPLPSDRGGQINILRIAKDWSIVLLPLHLRFLSNTGGHLILICESSQQEYTRIEDCFGRDTRNHQNWPRGGFCSVGHFPDDSALIASNLNYTWWGPEGV